MFKFTDNRKSIKDIYTMFSDNTLIVDNSYQRRAVWGERDKIRLIETILMGMVIPELFFWKSNTNPKTGDCLVHIVDGQQRIKAICEFIDGDFKLNKNNLLDDKIKTTYANAFFNDLSDDVKTYFWNYEFMIIDIDRTATKEDIATMFRRLNLTDFNLNNQEKRHTISGEFAALALDLSNLDIWNEYNIFNARDVKRMRDVEFCASLVLLYKNGIIDQPDQTALNNAYEDFQDGYNGIEKDKEAVIYSTDIIEEFFKIDDVIKFLRRKSQLYTLFSIVFYIMDKKIVINGNIKNKFKKFVNIYSRFDNSIDLQDDLNVSERNIFDLLKKYKLASSEGINKHTNRTIRFNVLKDFIFSSGIKQAVNSLNKKMESFAVSETVGDIED
ncbi:MAG: DUF262 domain-containing protein [Endomicrobia bacterium]|nr:DUF262 domain-containing protein [Endomicrobiia bacterium]